MNIATGIDIVSMSEFASSLEKGGERFLKKCFHASEIESGSTEHLAGVFAAKEAVIKATSLRAGSWLDIRVDKKEGRPIVRFLSDGSGKFSSHDLSISHSKDVAVAVFMGIF